MQEIRIAVNPNSPAEMKVYSELSRLGHKRKRVVMKILERFFAAYPDVSPEVAVEIVELFGIPGTRTAPTPALDQTPETLPEKPKPKKVKAPIKKSQPVTAEPAPVPVAEDTDVKEPEPQSADVTPEEGNPEIDRILSGLLAMQS